MTAWTAPRTWSDGETETASIFNTHVRDNLLALKQPAGGSVALGADINIASTSMTAISAATHTFTTYGGGIVAFLSFSFVANASSDHLRICFALDGVETARLANVYTIPAQYNHVAIHYVWTSVSAASHTVIAKWSAATPNQINLNGSSVSAGRFTALEAWF